MAALAGDLEGSALVGAEVSQESYGILSAGLRSGRWSALYNTDALSVRYQRDSDRGKAWLQAKGHGGVAGMFPFAWTDGALDPSRSLFAFTGGIEGGAQRYLGHGWYTGGMARAEVWAFAANTDTTLDVPSPRPVFTTRLGGGYWSDAVSLDVGGGVLLDGTEWVPQADGVFRAHPEREFEPFIELRVGVSANATEISKARLGGLNPYVVPLAGAGWAEFRVANYAAARIGPAARIGRVYAAAFADLATFDGQAAYGVGATAAYTGGPWTMSMTGGVAPGLQRQQGEAIAGFATLEHAWRRFKKSDE